MDEGERRQWRQRWSGTLWQLAGPDGGWQDLPSAVRAERGPCFALSAWNPGSALLPEAVNRARDALLAGELRARGEQPRRVRGGDARSGWWEEGWLINHDAQRDAALLRRYGQLAGVLLAGGRLRLLWHDGCCDADAPGP